MGASSTGDEIAWLTSVSVLIFAAAMIAGLAPLAFSKVTWMDKVTALGAGLCVGASLGLIIPEGFELLEKTNETHNLPHGLGGLSLTLGMMIFYALEHSLFSKHSHGPNLSHSYSSERERYAGQVRDKESDEDDEALLHRPSKQYKALSATFMMVCHAIADGLVLGAAATSDRPTISAVVALAMIAHKIPASFALGSYLVSMRISLYKVGVYMTTFAAASPLGAIFCYIIQFIVPKGSAEVGLCVVMLLSGGSVLYVGFHMLNEIKPDRTLTVIILLGSCIAAALGFIKDD